MALLFLDKKIEEKSLLQKVEAFFLDIWEELSDSRKLEVAGCINCPWQITEGLAHDKSTNEDFIHTIAGNPGTLPTTLSYIWENRELSDNVVLALAGNPSTLPLTLSRLVNSTDLPLNVRLLVAGNPNANEETLKVLSKVKDPDILERVISNPATPLNLLKEFIVKNEYPGRSIIEIARKIFLERAVLWDFEQGQPEQE